MLQIRPVSDLKSKFNEIEKIVSVGEPVFLTKNGYGSMVVLSIERYFDLSDSIEGSNYIEAKLDEADLAAEASPVRLSHEQVFEKLLGKE